jgi:hypothetical protein
MSALLAFIRADATRDVPVVPGTWEVVVEDRRWSSVYPLGRADGRFFSARLIARQSGTPTHAMFVCTGPSAMLTRLANQIGTDGLGFTQTWPSLPALRADAGATATAIKAAWPDERPLDGSGTPVGTLVAHYARVAGFGTEDAET